MADPNPFQAAAHLLLAVLNLVIFGKKLGDQSRNQRASAYRGAKVFFNLRISTGFRCYVVGQIRHSSLSDLLTLLDVHVRTNRALSTAR